MQNKFILYFSYFLIGIILIILSDVSHLLDGFWGGFGFGLLILSFIRFFQIWKIKNNSEYAEKIAIQATDERNQFIAKQARSNAFYYSVLIEALGVIITRFLNMPEISTCLGFIICFQLIIYLLNYLILSKKY